MDDYKEFTIGKDERLRDGHLGEINITEHRVDLLPDSKTIKSAPYRAGPKIRELIQAEVEKQLDAGVCEPARSEWAAPVLFVLKKDVLLRF